MRSPLPAVQDPVRESSTLPESLGLEVPPPSAAILARTLADRGLLRGAGWPAGWVWSCVATAAAVWYVAALAWGERGWVVLSLLALAASVTILRLRANAATLRAALLGGDFDRSWLWPLVEALRWRDGRVRAFARYRLLAVFPTVTASDLARLSDDQRAVLFSELTPMRAWLRPDFAEGVLALAVRTGSDQALRGAARLARVPAWLVRMRGPREAAKAALARLQEHVRLTAAITTPLKSRAASMTAADEPRAEAPAWLRETEAEMRQQPAIRFPFLISGWCATLPYFGWSAVHNFEHRRWLLSGVCFALTVASTQLYRIAVTPVRTRLAQRLAKLDDVEAVGGLVDLLDWPDEAYRSIATTALVQLLPRLRASDTHMLNAKQRAILCRWLTLENAARNSSLLLAILQAFEQVGDTDAVPSVRALGNAYPVTTPERRVCSAAAECLPALLARGEHNRHSQVLLRAWSDDHPERLLRSAYGASDIDPAVLVRASSVDGDEGTEGTVGA